MKRVPMFDKESRMLAEKVYEIESANYRQIKEWREQGITKHLISDHVYLEKSDDRMMWYLWKFSPVERRELCKAVPALHFYPKTIEKILKSQPWVCI